LLKPEGKPDWRPFLFATKEQWIIYIPRVGRFLGRMTKKIYLYIKNTQ